MLGLGEQITLAVMAEAKAQGYPLMGPDDILATLGSQPYQDLQKCLGRAECISRKLEPLGIDRAVVGTLGRDEKSYLVRLWLIDVRAHEVVADVDRSTLIASRRLMADVKLAVPDLLRGKREAKGTLKLSANTRSAAVTIDGQAAGKTPVEVLLKPGKHEVKLEKKAYLPVTRLVTVEPDAVTQEDIRMLLIPGETAEDEPTAVVQNSAAPQTEGGIRVPLSAWFAMGAGAAAAGVGIGFGVTSAHTEQQLKNSYTASGGYYAGTRSQALTGRHQAVTADICFAGAAAAGITATVLTVVNQNGTSVTVAPAAGSGRAGLLVEGRF